MNRIVKDSPRPTLAHALQILSSLGWTPSAGSWEDSDRVFAFAQESYPGTYGGTAAAVTWSSEEGWLVMPPRKPRNVRFV